MGCFHSKLNPCGPLDNPRTQHEAKLSSPPTTVALPDEFLAEQSLQGIRLYGVATCGEAALLCSRLIVARGHILAAVFEGHISPPAAEYCRSHCWEAFVQASASWQQAPAAATLRALDRGFLSSSKHSLESRLSSGCSATLLHIDLAARIVTVATVGAHGAVGLGGSAPPQPPAAADVAGAAPVVAAGSEAQVEARRRHAGRSKRQEQQQQQGAEAAASGRGQEGVGGRGQRAAGAGVWGPRGPGGPRPLRRFVTLEAPSAECRRGLSGLVDMVQSAMTPSTDPLAPAPPPALPLPAPELLAGGSTHGGGSIARRGSLGSSAPALGPAQALGFGCAKDALLVSAFESAAAAAAPSAAAAKAAGSGGVRGHVPAAPHAHAHVQPPGGGGRFGAISRLHCSCDVRVTSRPLVAGDECLVLLAGCGGAGGRAAAGGGSSNDAGDSGAGSAAAMARSVLAAAASGGLAGSAALAPLPVLFAPAGALSAADAVTLAHEVGAAPLGLAAGGGGGAVSMTTAGLTRGNRFDVLYDSYDSEAAALAAAGVPPSSPPPEAAAGAGTAGAPRAGDRGAQAVASHAVTAALRNREAESLSRGVGAPVTPPPSAACIAIWLDWSGVEAAGVAVDTGDFVSASRSPSPAAVRWELLRAYCRFLIARRRRISTAWHGLVAAAAAVPASSLPSGVGSGIGGSGGVALSWVPAQIAAMAGASVGGPAGSYESVTGGGVAAVGNRTASFTSRAPVMMEFVEELPTPAPSEKVTDGRGTCATAAGSAAASTGAAAVGGTVGGGRGVSASGTGMYAAAANAATLDDSHTHSASAAAPYGISGLVVQPMGSTEDVEMLAPDDNGGDTPAAAAGSADGGGTAAGSADGGGAAAATRRAALLLQSSQRSFVMPYASMLARRAEVLGLRPSHSTPDLQGLLGSSARTHADSPRWPHMGSVGGRGGGDDGGDSAVGRTADQAAAHEAEAVAYARGSAYYASQGSSAVSGASASSSAAAGTGGGGAAGGGGGAGGSGTHFDWSLIMASVHQNSGPTRPTNSAGHTPIPSTAANRLSPLGFSPEGASGAANPGAAAGGGDPQASAAGGYLPFAGSGSFRLRQAASAASPAQSPLSSPYSSRGAASAAPGSSRNDGGGSAGVGGSRGAPGSSSDMQAPPGVLVGRGSGGGGSAASDGDGADTEVETELISEDLPQLRIESTAELAALMAEIIITDDGEVVRTGGNGSGGGLPPPYSGGSGGGRSHHSGLGHHKGARSLSRQGSRGWQPRLAIVREDAREANTSTSCSQLLLGEGVRFTAISEERGSSQGSSGAGEHVVLQQGSSGGGSSGSQQSRLASSSNGTSSVNTGGNASNGSAGNGGSPNGSAEEQLAGLNGAAAAAILVPPTVPPARLSRGQLTAAAADDNGGGERAVAGRSAAVAALACTTAAAVATAAGVPAQVGVSALGPGVSPFSTAAQQQQQEQYDLRAPTLQPQLHAVNMRAAAPAAAAATAAAASATMDASSASAAAGAGGIVQEEAAARTGSFRRQRSAVAEAASSAAGDDSALAASIGGGAGCAVAQRMPLGAAAPAVRAAATAPQLWLRADPCSLISTVPSPPLPAPAPPAVGTALAKVLDYLRPSSGSRSHQAAVGVVGHSLAAAAGAASEGPEALDDGGGGDAGGRFWPSLAMVGRSRSASAARAPQPAHLRLLQHHCSLHLQPQHQNQHNAHHEPSGGGTDDGGGEALHSHTHASPARRSPGVGRSQLHPHAPAMPRARHLYGLTEATLPLAAAVNAAAARSFCSATAVVAATPPPPSPPPLAAYDATTAGGNTATTIDRSWSMGSASGPLCSLLQSTLSKSSIIAATSTAAQTPGCNSAHCSGGRLPTVNAAAAAVAATNTPLPRPLLSQASSPAAAAAPQVAAVLAPPTRVLPGARQEPPASGLRTSSVAAAAAVDAAAATVLPSLPAECAAPPVASAVDESASLSVTLQAPRFADWEPHAAASGGTVATAASGVGGSDGDGDGDTGFGTAAGGGGQGSSVFADAMAGGGNLGTHRPRYAQFGAPDGLQLCNQDQNQQQPQYHNFSHVAHNAPHRAAALPPTRLSRPGFAGGDSAFGSFAAVSPEGRDSTAGASVGSPHESSPAGAAASAAAAAAAMFPSRSPEISSTFALGTAASGQFAPPAGLLRPHGGNLSYAAAPVSSLADDDGGVNNRSSNISRSDASVWNSTSAWTASTGRTTEMTTVLGGSNRRTLAGAMVGGSSALMLHTGLAVAGGLGGGGGGGDTSGLLGYNAACSSASGLLMQTADAGAPGSNTQLLMQMAPPGAFGGVNNGQASSQLFCSPRYGVFFGGGGGGSGGGGEGGVPQVQMMAALAAQVRAQQPALYGASPTDAPQLLQHHMMHQVQVQALLQQQQQQQQQFLLPACGGVGGSDGRGGGDGSCPAADRPMGHLTGLPAPQAAPPGAAAAAVPQAPNARANSQASQQGQQQGREPPQQQPPHTHMYRPSAPGLDDSSSSSRAAPLFTREGVLDSGCYVLAGGSTSNNTGQP